MFIEDNSNRDKNKKKKYYFESNILINNLPGYDFA
jgi:hypothetical protein